MNAAGFNNFQDIRAAITFASLILMIGISKACADDFGGNSRGWYELGATIIEDAKLEDFFDQPLSGNKVKFDPGFRAAIALGTDILPFLAVEAEGGFHYNSIKSVSGATAGQGDLYQFPVMGNIVLQFRNRTHLVPVIGAGVGAVYSIFDAQNITLGTARFSTSQETWTFAYQGYAGLLYQFSREMAIGVTYHHLNNDGPSWRDTAGNHVKFNRLTSHSLSLTLNFRF
jgi:opacity protein-like surface antigen